MNDDKSCRPTQPSVILKMKSNKGPGDEIGVAKLDSDKEGWVSIELRTGHVIRLSPETVGLIKSGMIESFRD